MSLEATIKLLETERVGRIACVKESQPYITPLYFAYHERYLYSFATVGKRVLWMRANPLVCVEVERIQSRQCWQTVVLSGMYEELPDIPEYDGRQIIAHNLLSLTPDWWEPGFVKTVLGKITRPIETVYFRIDITEMTGHEAYAEAVPVA